MQAVQVTSQDMRAAISHEGRSMVPILQSIFQVCPAGSCCTSVQCGFLFGGVVCPACSTFSGSAYCALQFLLLRACLVRSAGTPSEHALHTAEPPAAQINA